MNWIKKIFSTRTLQPTTGVKPPPPPTPPGWSLTLDDLFAEMKAGKRKSIGNPEAEWAKEYESARIPEGTRFPIKGDLYASTCDQMVQYMTAWAAPFTGAGEALLLKGDRIWIENEPRDAKPIGTYALPVDYKKLEARMVPQADRSSSKYGGFYFYFKTVDLEKNFTLLQTGFKGKGKKFSL
jgi:hypothetical protein